MPLVTLENRNPGLCSWAFAFLIFQASYQFKTDWAMKLIYPPASGRWLRFVYQVTAFSCIWVNWNFQRPGLMLTQRAALSMLAIVWLRYCVITLWCVVLMLNAFFLNPNLECGTTSKGTLTNIIIFPCQTFMFSSCTISSCSSLPSFSSSSSSDDANCSSSLFSSSEYEESSLYIPIHKNQQMMREQINRDKTSRASSALDGFLHYCKI